MRLHITFAANFAHHILGLEWEILMSKLNYFDQSIIKMTLDEDKTICLNMLLFLDWNYGPGHP